jgi:hypothetical protein
MKTLTLMKTALCISALVLLASCTKSYQVIGKVDMLSYKSIDTTLVYKQLTSDSENPEATETTDINESVKKLIQSVPGGYYLTNVTLYSTGSGHYAVTGNVWGITNSDSLKNQSGININHNKF